MAVKVKICGITNCQQALMVQEAGADALGLVLYQGSSRFVNLERAIDIRGVIRPDVLCVALLVNAAAEFVKLVIDDLKPDLIQFHGDETPEFCQQFNFPYIRATRMRDDLDISAEVLRYSESKWFLFDAFHADTYGGTGKKFDWNRLPTRRDYALILAGGLTPENVVTAIETVSPDMVDVSGGVETGPGVKDEAKVRLFIRRVKSCS
jgi:phosphoribosylanthranilate isomerase